MTDKRVMELAVQCPHDLDIIDVMRFARMIERETRWDLLGLVPCHNRIRIGTQDRLPTWRDCGKCDPCLARLNRPKSVPTSAPAGHGATANGAGDQTEVPRGQA